MCTILSAPKCTTLNGESAASEIPREQWKKQQERRQQTTTTTMGDDKETETIMDVNETMEADGNIVGKEKGEEEKQQKITMPKQ